MSEFESRARNDQLEFQERVIARQQQKVFKSFHVYAETATVESSDNLSPWNKVKKNLRM